MQTAQTLVLPTSSIATPTSNRLSCPLILHFCLFYLLPWGCLSIVGCPPPLRIHTSSGFRSGYGPSGPPHGTRSSSGLTYKYPLVKTLLNSTTRLHLQPAKRHPTPPYAQPAARPTFVPPCVQLHTCTFSLLVVVLLSSTPHDQLFLYVVVGRSLGLSLFPLSSSLPRPFDDTSSSAAACCTDSFPTRTANRSSGLPYHAK